MPDWVAIVIGIALLALVASDRRNIGGAWRSPSRWWSRDPAEYLGSRRPSQPLNVLLGLVLGIACVAYGVISLVS